MKINITFNRARYAAYTGLVETIAFGTQKNNFTELDFRDLWLKNIQKHEGVIASGWYAPPPHGMAVLAGTTNYPSRISFDTLRNEPNWPTNNVINWKTNLLYCYCSPLNNEYGMPGDLAITLYFGNDERIIRHFQNTHKATHEVINALAYVKNSNELFDVSQEIFASHHLKNCVISKTDLLPLDLGHTYPRVLNPLQSNLSADDHKIISKARQFINATSFWDFTEGLQFTIEPQLVSLDDVTLPQISYHYLLCKQEDFWLCNDVDALMDDYNLLRG